MDGWFIYGKLEGKYTSPMRKDYCFGKGFESTIPEDVQLIWWSLTSRTYVEHLKKLATFDGSKIQITWGGNDAFVLHVRVHPFLSFILNLWQPTQ